MLSVSKSGRTLKKKVILILSIMMVSRCNPFWFGGRRNRRFPGLPARAGRLTGFRPSFDDELGMGPSDNGTRAPQQAPIVIAGVSLTRLLSTNIAKELRSDGLWLANVAPSKDSKEAKAT